MFSSSLKIIVHTKDFLGHPPEKSLCRFSAGGELFSRCIIHFGCKDMHIFLHRQHFDGILIHFSEYGGGKCKIISC